MFSERSKVLSPDISSIFAQARLPLYTGIYLMQTSSNCKLTASLSLSRLRFVSRNPLSSRPRLGSCCEMRLAVFSSDQSHDETSFWPSLNQFSEITNKLNMILHHSSRPNYHGINKLNLASSRQCRFDPCVPQCSSVFRLSRLGSRYFKIKQISISRVENKPCLAAARKS